MYFFSNSTNGDGGAVFYDMNIKALDITNSLFYGNTSTNTSSNGCIAIKTLLQILPIVL